MKFNRLFRLSYRLFILFSLQFDFLNAQIDALIFEKALLGLHDSDFYYFDKGKEKFIQEDYPEAVILFEKVKLPDQVYLNYLKGICYSHDADQREKALLLIDGLSAEAEQTDGYYFNLAYALSKNDSVVTALSYYEKALLAEEKKSSPNLDFIEEIKLRSKRCQIILDYRNKKSAVQISNIDLPVNTNAAEYCPLIPSNESFLIYTYRGPKSMGGKQKVKAGVMKGSDVVELFYEDIFITKRINDTLWETPKPITPLNTMLHDAAVSLNNDGTELIIYKNRGAGKGDLYMSKLEGDVWSKPIYQSGLNSPEWEGSACFIPFETKIIFESERAGGYGGKDLYEAELFKENKWGNIKNLGPKINTKHDEDDPFVTSDGRILFFSSNNSQSIGGYDIFRSDYLNTEWQQPYNLGEPINTTNDDKFFTVSADGKIGYYSSYKKGGKGAQDIYKIEPGIPGEPSELLQVEGLVTLDGKPSSAEVEIQSTLKNKNFSFRIKANSASGKFLGNLPCGDHYQLLVTVPSLPPKIIELNTTHIDSFVVLNVFVEFNSNALDIKLALLDKKEKEQLQKSNTEPYDNSYARNFGDKEIEGLFYKIQIGAYKFPEGFNYTGSIGMPKVLRQIGKDDITRFTMGNFSTYNKAIELLKTAHKNKITDAFIVAFYKGERKLLSQLIEEKITE